MKIRYMKETDINGSLSIFNEATLRKDFLYETLNTETFKQKFIQSTFDYDICSFVAENQAQIVGFSSGVFDKVHKKAYITMIVVKKAYARQGIGSKLLKALEVQLLEAKPKIQKIEIVFFNPINLSWTIPNTKALHPNAPGVDQLSIAYKFFNKHNYLDFAVQNVYYMDIKNYAYSEVTKQVIDSVEAKGFKFDYYDIKKDQGLNDLLIDLGSPVWKKVVLDHVASKGKKNTLLVPTFNHRVAGFTGPLCVEESGRGYFAGIGTHSEFRGFGLGKALFAKLVMGLKNVGASYMTLFTGENNPARRMYEKEGFKIVRTFIDLRKEVF